MNTITVSVSLALCAGVQIFKYRQSSLMGTNPSCQALLPSVSVGGCMHAAEKWSAALTPCQATTGCGGRQRRLPTGAAASGIPRNSRTPGLHWIVGVPVICPPSMLIGSGMPAQISPAAVNIPSNTHFILIRSLQRARCEAAHSAMKSIFSG